MTLNVTVVSRTSISKSDSGKLSFCKTFIFKTFIDNNLFQMTKNDVKPTFYEFYGKCVITFYLMVTLQYV